MSDLEKVIEQVEKDKGISKASIIDALETAFLSAARKKLGMRRELEAHFNPELGEIELFEFKTVIEKVKEADLEISLLDARVMDPEVNIGDSIGIKLDSSELGRIAAQTAKQVIFQKVKEAELGVVYDEFNTRKGEIINGVVRRIDKNGIVIDLGKTEALMPYHDQIKGENYKPGDRVQAYLKDVQATPRGTKIIVSRSCNEYLAKLLEQEIPEIAERVIELKNIAREPGFRAKVAVYTSDPNIDPVGACVGVRGSRIQNVVTELKGEKMDIVEWDENLMVYVCNAIAPAEVSKVIVNENNNSMEIVVKDDQLYLAIGKRGQNIRLASQLVGWGLNVISESDYGNKLNEVKFSLMLIPGIDEFMATNLYQNGFQSIFDVAEADAETIMSVPGYDEEAKALDLKARAQKVIAEGGDLVKRPEPIMERTPVDKNDEIMKKVKAEIKAQEDAKAAQNSGAES